MRYDFGGMGKKGRITFLSIVIGLFFVVYIFNLFSMQIVNGSEYDTQSRTISSRTNTIPAQRGEIFDRHAVQPMVINTDSFVVMMVPGEIPEGYYDNVATRLASFLGMSKYDIDRRVPKTLRKSYQQIPVRTNVPFDIISNIAENRTDLPGVSWVSRPQRYYVETGSMSHILGYVGDITQEEVNVMYNEGYTRNSIIGKTGIEKQYDSDLRGTPGWESRTVDARGRIISDRPVVVPPKMGNNIVLTVDTQIQKLAEDTLGERVGAVVVMRPYDGEILAMVSYPYYDPNLFTSDDMNSQYSKLANNPLTPLVNRAVNAVYPPASTFKIIMTAALLQEEVFPDTQKIECTGEMLFGNRVFHCHVHRPGHGWLDLKNGLAQSCDVYYWTVGYEHLGIDRIASFASEFGLGKSTEIDLPSHSVGLVPTPQWKERRFHMSWLGGDTMNISIGQGNMTVTPLQIANMMAMVSNAGTIYKPHLLKEVRDPVTNEVVREIKRDVLFSSNISSDVWRKVQEDLRYTITNGSAEYPMHNPYVKIAGKTGTAEVAPYKDSWHSWMVAYAPYDAPPQERVVVATIVEAVNKWEWWAPYATNIIIQGIFANQTSEEAMKALGFEHLQNDRRRHE